MLAVAHVPRSVFCKGEMMDKPESRPEVRVIKGSRSRPKAGVIRVDTEDGKTYFRGPCDRCSDMVRTDFQPSEGRELLCRECRWVADKAKPSTRLKRKHGKVLHYLTECDECGDRQKTPFMPKRDRRFLCDACFAEHKEHEPAVVSEPDVVPEPQAPSDNPWRATSIVKPKKLPDPDRLKNQEPARFNVICRSCRKVERLRFRPDKGEYFLCKDCYLEERERKEARKNRPDTRLIFQIECADCGKHETVDFVPRDLTEPICSDCFEKRKKERRGS